MACRASCQKIACGVKPSRARKSDVAGDARAGGCDRTITVASERGILPGGGQYIVVRREQRTLEIDTPVDRKGRIHPDEGDIDGGGGISPHKEGGRELTTHRNRQRGPSCGLGAWVDVRVGAE